MIDRRAKPLAASHLRDLFCLLSVNHHSAVSAKIQK